MKPPVAASCAFHFWKDLLKEPTNRRKEKKIPKLIFDRGYGVLPVLYMLRSNAGMRLQILVARAAIEPVMPCVVSLSSFFGNKSRYHEDLARSSLTSVDNNQFHRSPPPLEKKNKKKKKKKEKTPPLRIHQFFSAPIYQSWANPDSPLFFSFYSFLFTTP